MKKSIQLDKKNRNINKLQYCQNIVKFMVWEFNKDCMTLYSEQETNFGKVKNTE